ncbi:MAG: rhamnulokinase family protein [Chloroflexota bacterium]
MATKTVLAIDLGAESGRVMAVHFDGETFQLNEVNRFPNHAVTIRGTLHWDIVGLWRHITDGIEQGQQHRPASIGVDTWGVDFALLDGQGNLLGLPVHYRDRRTEGVPEKVLAKVPRETIFTTTGIQVMPINTLYQLASMVEAQSPLPGMATTFLTIPDLLNYWLTGERVCEFSNASTTQMLKAGQAAWATDLLQTLDIPTHMLPQVVAPGTRLGTFAGTPVIAPACHDTGSAVAAVPATHNHFAYISSGTWSLAGIETDSPLLTPEAARANVTNESGVCGTNRLLKNIMGLWILQQCRAVWQSEGFTYTYEELVQLAESAPALQSIVYVNEPAFLHPGNHVALIRDACAASKQPVPQTHGAITRTVFESLALAYREVFETLERIANHPIEVIHIIGGGAQNHLLNQFTANATGKPVIAGPVEATVLGNALMQFMTLGELTNLSEARQIIARMEGTQRYEPMHIEAWNHAYQQYQQLARSN